MTTPPPLTPAGGRRVRVAIVGAGFSGIAMALALKRAGHAAEMVIIDRAPEFGGTWRDNIYPGCACDVPSHLYAMAGETHDWPAIYSHQPAIQEYLLGIVDKHGLCAHARLGNGVARQIWDDAAACWTLTLDDGQTVDVEVVVNGVGPLSRPVLPAIDGIDRFLGPAFHSAQWDAQVDLTGKRVGIIGTGASAVQIAPAIAEQVGHLTVFQRTPSWVLPRLEHTFSPTGRWALRHVPGAQQLLRGVTNLALEHLVWQVLAQGPRAQRRARRLGAWNIRAGIEDPPLRRAVTPTLAPGCKRIMFSNAWYPTLNRDDVDLETRRITTITPNGVCLDDRTQVELDVLVYGTGFDPHHFWFPMEVVGQGGRLLRDHWQRAGRAYMSTTTRGFPNMFFLLGPNTGTGHNSVVLMAEAQVGYISQALEYLRTGAVAWLTPTAAAETSYVEDISRRHEQLVWASGCGSWYLNEVGINDTLYPGPVRDFQRRLARFDIESYQTSTPLGPTPSLSAPPAHTDLAAVRIESSGQ